MKHRTLGSSLRVSSIGLGCMGMSMGYGAGDDDESIRTLHRALELGVDFFDTADVYGKGRNEELIAKALQGRRGEIVLATKFGIVEAPEGGGPRVNGRPDYVRSACDASLRRLGVETIDLYYLHRVDPDTPIEETVGAMSDLVAAGKVRFLGLSEAAPATIRRAHAVHPIAALQSEYSLWMRDVEGTVLPVCRELGIALVPFSPLGRGFLSGAVTDAASFADGDMRKTMPRFQAEHLQRNLELVEGLETMARRKGCTPAQLALAWLLAQGDDIVPIPGTKRRTYLEQNVAAAALELTADERDQLAQQFAPGAVSGERYGDSMMKLIDRG